MQFTFEVFLCMLFGVVCVAFIVWIFQRSSGDGIITTTEYTVPQDLPTAMPVQYSVQPQTIDFTNMRLLVYYSRIAVQAVDQMSKAGEIVDAKDRKSAAINLVLSYCKVDGLDADNDIIAVVPSVIEYVVAESREKIF